MIATERDAKAYWWCPFSQVRYFGGNQSLPASAAVMNRIRPGTRGLRLWNLLDLAFQLLATAVDHVEIVVGELTPLLLHLPFHLLPISGNAVPIHCSLLLQDNVGRKRRRDAIAPDTRPQFCR